MTSTTPMNPDDAQAADGVAIEDGHPSSAGATSSADTARTLFSRNATGTQAVDSKVRARRERLLSHADRSRARRHALAELLRSGALADAASVDPLLRQDVMRLVAFVRDDKPVA
ncbi:MAG: hypothetical protein KF871_12480 [Hydrogenophaga sp.]|uniref:hypothetical protein n=1 Tax=Hydrogenophaga sp. TaxID=1904254 RepID=UPI001DEE9043|nr:hypothetical protein [Hydrogenophaga sp.]MBX3610702.1 hypothetical protein [Hydrogenophaga sp.]